MGEAILGSIWTMGLDGAFVSELDRCMKPSYRLVSFASVEALGEQLPPRTPVESPRLILARIHTDESVALKLLDLTGPCGMSPLVILLEFIPSARRSFCLLRGAVDVVLAPVEPSALWVRLQRFLLAPLPVRPPLRLDLFSLSAHASGGESVTLPLKQFQILHLLNEAYPARVHKLTLFRQIWRSTAVVTNALDVHLSHLRRALCALGVKVLYDDGWYSLRLPAPSLPDVHAVSEIWPSAETTDKN